MAVYGVEILFSCLVVAAFCCFQAIPTWWSLRPDRRFEQFVERAQAFIAEREKFGPDPAYSHFIKAVAGVNLLADLKKHTPATNKERRLQLIHLWMRATFILFLTALVVVVHLTVPDAARLELASWQSFLFVAPVPFLIWFFVADLRTWSNKMIQNDDVSITRLEKLLEGFIDAHTQPKAEAVGPYPKTKSANPDEPTAKSSSKAPLKANTPPEDAAKANSDDSTGKSLSDPPPADAELADSQKASDEAKLSNR